jgi:DNA-binding XRE family transcriptional regulator
VIRNEREYGNAVRRIMDEENRIKEHRAALAKEDYTAEQIKRALDPLLSFHLQLKEEVESYERLKRGDLGELSNLHGLGMTLIGLRIALGLTQREFAKKLGANETQISRDERNEYHGITVERASQILDHLGVTLRSQFSEPIPRERPLPEDDDKEAPSTLTP